MKTILIIFACILLMATATSAQTSSNGSGPTASVVKIVKFYPNPAVSLINFEFSSDLKLSNYSFKVFNFIGKKVIEINNLSSRTVVNLNDFFRGVYIFQLTDRTGKVIESGKFQVAK